MDDIEKKVIAIVAENLGKDVAEVTKDSNFSDDLGADSLDQVELVMDLEKHFGIEISDDEAEKIDTVSKAITFIEKNMNK